FRILGNIPDGSRDMIIEKSTLLECNMDRLNAISWTKGCYMGQELTARMHHRGLVKKRLFPVKVEGPAPAVGTPITLNGEDVGDMRSHSGNVGLALVNIEKAEMAINHTLSLASADSHLRIIGRPQI
ncbi:MAG TPA: tRNA-modifying protein YgfZ, partial [Alphaproteobacteria bacterium]|nr:tRNA-modifying protein YgfZ [Alphaproteobacteria bacterium]